MCRIGEGSLESRGNTVCGDHVKSDARAYDNTSSPRRCIQCSGVLEYANLASDVEVMGTRGETDCHHRCGCCRERSRTIEDKCHPVDTPLGPRCVFEIEDARLHAKATSQLLHLGRRSPGQHRI